MKWENVKEEKMEALDSWIECTKEELEFAEAIYAILENSTSKREFAGAAKEKLREGKNPWTEDSLQSILNLVVD
jgi:hypothetical protein